MYIPAPFETRDLTTLHRVLRAHPFALLLTVQDGQLHATHLPVVLDPSRGPLGLLEAHLARTNPHARALQDGIESLLVCSGPQAYVSPRWYSDPAANVPTWNYQAVHATVRPRTVVDRTAVLAMLDRLTREHEAYVDPPWTLAEGSAYAERIVGGVVAFELEILRLEGKTKMNQNKAPADRLGVMRALSATHPDVVAVMQGLYDERGELR